MSVSLQRAYATLEIKRFDDAQGVIEGIASTPTLDRQADIMDPDGAKFTLPIPLLWHHKGDQPIGHVTEAKVTKSGIRIKAKIATGLLPRIDEAWTMIRAGLVRGLSIGWRPLEQPTVSKDAYRYAKWEWLELSAVTIPANVEASITSIKSFDAAHLAALGTGSRRTSPSSHPGVSGLRKDAVMTYSEQIAAAKTELQTKSARLEELMTQDETDGGLSDDETKERDTITAGVKAMVQQVDRLEALEAAQAAQAKGLTMPVAHQKATPSHTPRVEVVKPELPKGTLFTRYAMAKAAGKGSISDTLAYAKRWDSQTPEVSAYIKAEAGTAVVQSPGWGGELVYADNLASEFVDLLRPMTIVGRVQGFRTTPFNVRIPVQSGGSTVNWVGEKAPKSVTELSFTTISVPYHKIAGIVVLTDELIRLSSPAAEETVRRDLTEQIAQFMDQQFIQVAVTAGANNPASITQGVASPAASSTTLAALMADLNTAIASIAAAEISTDGLVIVTTPAVALQLSLMVTSLGQSPSGFNVTPTGGTLLGYPVIVSSSVDAGTMVIFKPSEVFLADDGRVSLDASNQATLDMAGGETPDFNLWQRNCTAIRAERYITWVKRRPGAVAVIDTIAYVPGT